MSVQTSSVGVAICGEHILSKIHVRAKVEKKAEKEKRECHNSTSDKRRGIVQKHKEVDKRRIQERHAVTSRIMISTLSNCALPSAVIYPPNVGRVRR